MRADEGQRGLGPGREARRVARCNLCWWGDSWDEDEQQRGPEMARRWVRGHGSCDEFVGGPREEATLQEVDEAPPRLACGLLWAEKASQPKVGPHPKSLPPPTRQRIAT